MFRMRRYRIFLIAAVFTTLTVYYLSQNNYWDVPDLQTLKNFRFSLDKSKPKHPAVDLPRSITALPQVSESATLRSQPHLTFSTLNDVPLERTTTTTSFGHTSITSVAVPAERPTSTGEELLKIQTEHDEEFGAYGEGRVEVTPYPTSAGRAHWTKPIEHFPVAPESLIDLPTGRPKPIPPIQYTFTSESPTEKLGRQQKQTVILEAFQHAWTGYKTFAMGHDELRPISNGTRDPFNGWGATLVDSLDTLWILGLKSEFEEALTRVKAIDFTTSSRKDIPLFETTIRYLGGLLSAYDLSSEMILLDKAVELAEILIGAFDTPNRMPQGYYRWPPSYASQPHRADSHMVMSELGSLAMEFTRLAQITKEAKYYDAIARVTNALQEWQHSTSLPGLWPVKLDASGCQKVERRLSKSSKSAKEHLEAVGGLSAKPDSEGADDGDNDVLEPMSSPLQRRQLDDGALTESKTSKPQEADPKQNLGKSATQQVSGSVIVGDRQIDLACDEQGLGHEPNRAPHVYSIGAMADSTYEYFPKMHVLLGGLAPQYMTMYEDALEVIREQMLYRPMIKEKRDILFPAEIEIKPAILAGAHTKKVTYTGSHLLCFVGGMFGLGARVFGLEDDMTIARRLTDGCVWSYESMPTGIMPEHFELLPCPSTESCPWDEAAWYNALDPFQQDRFAAVDQWNANQKVLWEKKHEKPEEQTDESQIGKRQAASKKAGESTSPQDSTVTPSKTFSVEESLEKDDDATLTSPSAPAFMPKVALSHEKFAQARISEERLPEGYTTIGSREYKLRPEAIESVFIMYRLTGEDYWREKGWQMFQSVQSLTLSQFGNAALKDVTSLMNEQEDVMESFWLAETLKYYYLLFSDPSVISLDDYVFNTEAHPFKIPR